MDPTRGYLYYVVEFNGPERPYTNPDKYICVPDSWIRFREITDQIAIIKYPVEKPTITKKRVKNGERYSEDWMIFAVNVKYGTDSYNDAKKYIDKLEHTTVRDKTHAKIINDNKLMALNDKQKSEPNLLNLKPMRSKTPALRIARGKSCDADSATKKKVLKQSLMANYTPAAPSKISNAGNTTRKSRKYLTRQATKSQHSRDTQSLSPRANSLDQNKLTSETSKIKLNDCVERSKPKNSRSNEENESSMNHYIPDSTDELIIDSNECREPIFGPDFLNLLQNMHSYLEQSHLMFERMRIEYIKHSSMVKDMIVLVENFNDLYSDPIATTSEEMAAMVILEKDKGIDSENVTGSVNGAESNDD